ncbi:hypothetical protein MTR67_052474 [Solanum verrucosum]|uniref:Reverse transcriptase zinc-binding domain-containing protein n=1 Tax=Solanum verrucosum TaxID=315347 RepID=A0AAF1A3J5_SOLVR|nr:hypothetical protein MTR67_052474 [Solanum verrucosum]
MLIIRKILEAREVVAQVQLTISVESIIKQIYFHLLHVYPKVTWKCLMYKNVAIPKAQFIIWLPVHGKLLTTDRLAKWRIDVEPDCVFCQNSRESRDHKCTFSRQLWSRILLWLQTPIIQDTTWEQHMEWVIKNAKGRTMRARVFKILYTLNVSMPYG